MSIIIYKSPTKFLEYYTGGNISSLGWKLIQKGKEVFGLPNFYKKEVGWENQSCKQTIIHGKRMIQTEQPRNQTEPRAQEIHSL